MIGYILNPMGYMIWIWSIFDSWGDVKSTIMLVVGLIFAGLRVWSIIIDVKKNNLITMNTKRIRKVA